MSLEWCSCLDKSPEVINEAAHALYTHIYIIYKLERVATTAQAEAYHAYYDIFVRHAFGSYRDVLREVAYSPVMGAYLTFLRNKAVAVSGNFPDENFARG